MRRLALFILTTLLMSLGSDPADARNKRPKVDANGCTAERLLRVREEDRIAYDWCAAKMDQAMLSGGVQWQFVCGASGVWCCPDEGQCFNVSMDGPAPSTVIERAPVSSPVYY